MIRRIGLLGGECTGKSVLAASLEGALGACVVGEQLRGFVDRHGRPPTQDEQAGVMRAQMEAEEIALAQCAAPWLVADPAPLMTAVYSEVYFDDASLTELGLAHAATYDLLLWCDRDIPWVPDGAQRDGPQFRDREHAVIADLVRDADLSQLTVLSGSVEQRVRAALAACAEVA